MKKHLNLFYSYNQGNLSNSERIKQLEDNLTRALIVTLKNLEYSTQIEFLKRLLLRKNINSKSFVFDLQNTFNYTKKPENEKFLIVIQRDKSSFDIGNFQKLNTAFLEKKTEEEKKKLEKDIKKHLNSASDTDFLIENVKIKSSELNSILQFLYGNRPDAWIIGNKEDILIESKIGNNSVSKYQIYRHITGKNGFKIKPSELKENSVNLSIINITWGDLCNIFSQVEVLTNKVESFLISEFLKYISMTGQKLNLDYIINGEVDSEIHREQFSLFLTQLDAKLKELNLPFKRQNRAKSGLWDVYGMINKKDEVSKNPHYSVGLGNDGIGISLTTTQKNQINDEFLKMVENYFEEKYQTSKLLSRYKIMIKKYHLVDWAKGQQRGEWNDSFDFYVEFSEIKSNIKTLCNIIKELTKMKIYKQFELGYQIRFFDFSRIRENDKDNQIRYQNKKLLENPSKLINEFALFIKETSEMYNSMND